jgi:multiple sugar transport system substrate-binding protein
MCIVVLLAACGPALPAVPEEVTEPAENPTAETGDETASTILRFAVSITDRGRYDNLIDAFEADNPDVHISTVSVEETLGMGGGMGGREWPEDAYLRLAAAADVIGAPATREAVQQGALLDLSNLFESDSNLTVEAFYPALLESAQWDGGIWSVPVEATYPLIYFNRELFDAAGLDYPEPGWSWDDFLAAARALTIRDGDAVSQWGFVQPSFDPVTFVQSKAGLLFDPATRPPSAKLDSAAVVDAVRWYTDLFLTHEVAPYPSQSWETGGPMRFPGGEGMQAINDGRAAMWVGTAGFGPLQRGGGQQRGRGSLGETTGAAPFPVDSPGDHSSPVEVEGLSISAGTQKADLAWQWVSFLAQQQAGRGRGFNALASGAVLAIPSVAASSGFWDNQDEAYAAALQYAIDHAYVDTYDGAGYDTFTSAVAAVIEEGTPIEAALADAQTEVVAEIADDVSAAPTPVAGLVVAEEMEAAVNAGAVIIAYGMGGGGGPGRFGMQSLSGVVEQFQDAHPDILVEVDTPQGFRGQLGLADMAAEYDCFQASPSFDDESLAAIMNMEPFLAADPGTSKEDFFPSALEQFTYQGQLWGLPGSVTVNLMNYNKDLFDAAGLAYPSADWTTSDFLEMAIALTEGDDEDRQYGYVPSSFGANDLVSILDRLGAEMLDESVDPPRLVFDSPSVVEAFRWYTSVATQYGVQPAVSEDAGDFEGGRDRQALISEGRAGMWMDSSGGFGGPGRFFGSGGPGGATDLNIGVVPLPSGLNSAKGSGFQSVDGYFISSQTGARQACWEWITFLTEQPNATSSLPARRSVAESAAYREQVGAEQAEAYVASVSSGSRASFFQRISNDANWLGFASFWLTDAYNRVINDEMTVEESLSAAQESVDAYRDCVITNNALQDPEAMRECLSESGANAPRMP